MNILRWVLVLPAAVLAQLAVRMIGGAVAGAAAILPGTGARESPPVDWLHLLLFYVVSTLAFVVAGAKTAPRRQSATAVALAILGIGLSLMKHVLGQQLAGNRVGSTNFLHFGLESAGFLVGAGLIFVSARKQRGPVARSSNESRRND